MAKYKIVAGAVVLSTEAREQVYLYPPAVVDSGTFTEESINHALKQRLIEELLGESKTGSPRAKRTAKP